MVALSAFLNCVQLLRGVNLILLPWWEMYSSSRLMPLLQIAVQDLPEATNRLLHVVDLDINHQLLQLHHNLHQSHLAALSDVREVLLRIFVVHGPVHCRHHPPLNPRRLKRFCPAPE